MDPTDEISLKEEKMTQLAIKILRIAANAGWSQDMSALKSIFAPPKPPRGGVPVSVFYGGRPYAYINMYGW